jgi:hypothetical protein
MLEPGLSAARTSHCGYLKLTACRTLTLPSPRLLGLSSSTMVRSTHIARASDALPLAASVDDEEVSITC